MRARVPYLDGILKHERQEAMGVADGTRCQPRLEQRAKPLLHMLWAKLLKFQRAQVRSHLPGGKLVVSLQCLRAHHRRAVEP